MEYIWKVDERFNKMGMSLDILLGIHLHLHHNALENLIISLHYLIIRRFS